MRIRLLLCVILALSGLAAYGQAKVFLDYDTNAWKNVVVIVGSVPASRQETTIRTVKVQRVLYTPVAGLENGDEIAINMPDNGENTVLADMQSGDYILFVYVSDGKYSVAGVKYILAPFYTVLAIHGLQDPIIDDAQIIIDTARIPSLTEKSQRISELLTKYPGHPLIAQYVIAAKQYLLLGMERDLVLAAQQLITNYQHNTAEEVYIADAILIEHPERSKILYPTGWSSSEKRKEVYQWLDKQVPHTQSLLRKAIDTVLASDQPSV